MPTTTDTRIDPFSTLTPSASSPARRASLVTPNDGQDLPVFAKALRIFNPGSGSATLRVTYSGAADDATTVDLTVPPGLTMEPSSVRRLWSTGTTAGLVVHAYTH